MVNYHAVGSGGGIAQIKAKTVAFANSDMPLKPEYLGKDHLVQFPVVIIGITSVVNVPGIKPGELTLLTRYLPGQDQEMERPTLPIVWPRSARNGSNGWVIIRLFPGPSAWVARVMRAPLHMYSGFPVPSATWNMPMPRKITWLTAK